MMSRFSAYTMFFALACLTSGVSGQSGYYPTSMPQPAPAAYPRTELAGGWNAGSPTGISALPQRFPQSYAPAMSPAPTPMGYAPMAAGYPPMPAGYAPMPMGYAPAPAYVPAPTGFAPAGYAPTPAGYAPVVAGYGPMVAGPSPANPTYSLPTPAPSTAPSYWTDIAPPTNYAPQAQPGATGYFAPMNAPLAQPNYAPISHAYGDPTAGPPAAAHVMPEGSVLNQPAPSVQSQQQMVPYDGSIMADGGEFYGTPATPGMYGFMSGSAMGYGYGYGNARFGSGAVGCTSPWFVGFGGLVMSRDDENPYLFSYDSANESIQLTDSRNANFDWAGGLEVNFGRMFNCGQNAVEAVYWGLFPSDGVTTTTDADTVGTLNGILNWDQLNYGLDPFLVPRTADEFVNNSTMHMVRRQNEIHNIEVNLLTFLNNGHGGCGVACGKSGCDGGACGSAGKGGAASDGDCAGCSACGGAGSLAGLGYGGVASACGATGSRWSHDWLVGIRFFSFRDNLLFGAEETGGNLVFANEDDEIYYNIDITNNLVGAQLGASGAYAVSCRCSLDYGLKFGLFGNQVDHRSEIGGNQGVATIANGPNAGIDFFVENKKKDIAFLGEANLGLSWRFGNCWSAKVGYRAVAVTGVALPTNQIWHDLRGIQDVRWVDSNGSLILHGGYARAEYRF